MKTLAEEFREIRRAATPWVCVVTNDYRLTMRELLKVRYNGTDEQPPAVQWTCVTGPVTIGDAVIDLGNVETAPFVVLANALKDLPNNGILFWVVPDDYATPNHFWTNPFTVQAVAMLRDEFKANRRTLVILSIDGKLPPLIADDVPLLKDPLPTEAELTEIAEGLVKTMNAALKDKGKKPTPISAEVVAKGARTCRGMTRFAAEEAFSRNMSGKTGLDLENLAVAQRLVIEQSSEGGLAFERGGETFDDIGGLGTIKEFSQLIFNGERPPTVVVRIEEIEKAMAGSGSALGDSTGVSQDQLGVLLTCMEDNDWKGLIAVGIPGSGKSLISKAMGNTYKVPSLTLDLGSLKGQYVGQSEAKIRKAMNILKSFAGKSAFFVATSNGLSVIPPELRRRFSFGIWGFDLPASEERESIWKINLQRFGLPMDSERPDDEEFTGSDIRNVCDLASRLRCPLKKAVQYIVPVSKSDPQVVARFREAAHGKFLSASKAGVYKKPEPRGTRAVTV